MSTARNFVTQELATVAELSWDQIEATQNAANKQAGPRYVPGRSIPVPNTASPSLQTTIAAPYRVPAWDADPKDAAA